MKIIMKKISGGVVVHNIELNDVLSEHHAIIVAQNFYRKSGLIGRYYCETCSGKTFQINY